MEADELFDIFAITAPGLEPVCARELAAIGATAEPRIEGGGVAWSGTTRSLYTANLECRTASRVVVRAGEFRARTFAELERHAARIDWSRMIGSEGTLSLRVTCRKSKLYHEGAVAERLENVLVAAVGAHVERSSNHDDADGDGGADDALPQLVIVRFMRDVCTISIDSSGTLLHQRGYRQALAKAPVRETIAAAMLLAADWDGSMPLIDPMCGSGTIPIEAALIARRIAPGLASPDRAARAFAFEQWPYHDASLWNEIVGAARERIRPEAGVAIIGADRDAGAITAATANAQRAGVAADLEFRRATVTELVPPAGIGQVVTNPPYGVRVGDTRSLQPLYVALGRIATERLPGWTLSMLAATPRLAEATGLQFTESFATKNGGLPVKMLTAHIASTPG